MKIIGRVYIEREIRAVENEGGEISCLRPLTVKAKTIAAEAKRQSIRRAEPNSVRSPLIS